ncbi:MAG TPA: serine hydrolase domain-containing protein, partial [Anaeromyxobacteraceae bacterium]|nr:serine hydrolase domain-containing protein [Anaeromyxobacteraceae bacterium]
RRRLGVREAGGWRGAIALVAAIAIGCGGSRPVRRDAIPDDDRLGRALAAVRAAGDFPGAVAAIATDGSVTTAAVGWADREGNVPMRPGDRMPAGDVGKTFTAAVVLSLAGAGLVQLDAPVARWLGNEPWFARLPNAPDLTLRHLLMHRGGIPNHATVLEFVRTVQARTTAAEPGPDPAPRALVELVLDEPPLFPAGAGFAYSDTGYVLAGLVVERVTGRHYADVLAGRVLLPLALDATAPAAGRMHRGLVPGYADDTGPLGLEAKTAAGGVMAFDPGWEWAGGGLVSNARDLARFVKALFDGRALPPGAIDDLLASKLPGDVRYGLGLTFYGEGTDRAYGHSGWFPGYRTEVRYYPARRAAIALQVNGDAPLDADAAFAMLLEAVP